MYDYITPQKPINALQFLKGNNSLYSDVEVNEWFEKALANDEELCKYLVEQNNNDMDAEHEKLCGNHCAGNAKNTNGDISTLPVNEESEPMECSSNALDGNDAFSVALRELEALVRLNGFSIHDVPYDGSCMFSAISYQLQSTGVCDVNSDELRQMVADYLEANPSTYCDAVSQPMASHDA